MPQILYPPARPQTVREVLDTGWLIFKATVGPTLSYAMLMSLTGQFPNLYNIALGRPLLDQDQTDPQWWGWVIFGLILSLFLWGALMLRQKALVSGDRANVLGEMKVAGIQLSRLIATVALCMVAIGVALGLYVAGSQLLGLAGIQTTADQLKALALSPLTLPAVWLSVALMFAPMLVVLNRQGPLDALAGSLRLVRGHWWRVSVITGVIFLQALALLLFLMVLAGVAVSVGGLTDVRMISMVALPVGIVYSALSSTLVSAMMLAVLGDLSVRLEAPPSGPLA